MPGGDRTGPMGIGPMSGRSAGYCAGFNTPGYANPAGMYPGGYRFFNHRGRGFRFRNYFNFPSAAGWTGNAGYTRNPAVDLDYLKAEKNNLESSLEEIKKQIEILNEEINKTEG